ncbi:MAG TPA: hypothetical protein VJP45_04590, partial [Candidatus Limnocylindria bacterium]|nr:hypothetical protein [Candidatus Limnocylindria bacterium]
EERPPVTERPRARRRTAAVPDVQVNLESGTPVEQMARELGAEPIPELGRARDRDRNGGRDVAEPERPAPESGEVPIASGEARRTLKARREHSKGDGNFPRVEPGAEMLDERPEDREPRDLPKARDDRSAPKGNVTVGQDDRNPDLVARDDHRAPSPRTFAVAPRRTVGPAGPRPEKVGRAAATAKAKPKVAAGAKRTRAGRKPAGTKTNVRKRAAPARARATRKAMKPTKATRAKAARKSAKPARRGAKPKRGTARR